MAELYVGVDPGRSGAWVALQVHGGRPEVLSYRAWTRSGGRRRGLGDRYGYRVEAPMVGSPEVERGLWGAWMHLRYLCHTYEAVVVVEGLFGRGNTLRVLAESAGPAVAIAEEAATNDITRDAWRPLATTWRPAVLGCPGRTPSDRAGELARAWCVERGLDLPGEHAAEAACMAWYGYLLTRGGR